MTSTNSIASIYAWTRGLWHRGRLDGNEELMQWALDLEKSIVYTVLKGKMTKDLAILVTAKKNPPRETWRSTEEFLDDVAKIFAFNNN